MLGASMMALALMSRTGMTQDKAAPPPAAAASPAPVAGPVPVEAFALLPEFESPSLSPDGTRIAAKRAINGKQFLMVAPLVKGQGKPALAALGDKVDVDWRRWVDGGWLVLGLGRPDRLRRGGLCVTRLSGII